MDKNHLDIHDLFAKILTENASQDEQKRFQNWLEESEGNQSEFEKYRKVWESTLPTKTYDLQAARLKTELKIFEKLKEKRGIFYYWQRIAAILLLPLLIYTVYSDFSKNGNDSNFVQNVKTPYGARTSFELPDGSVVWLNSGSEISYPDQFGDTREIKLTGEAFFEVTKSKTPFIVQTDHGDVQVLGTKFNVSAYLDEPFKTTLVEGSVAISDKVFNKKALLKPGYQYAILDNKPEVVEVPVEMYTSWKDGKLIFRREPFDLVAKRLEKWFNVTIVLEGESIKNLWYTGTLEMESFSEVLELIKNTTPIEYSFDSKTRILSITSKI